MLSLAVGMETLPYVAVAGLYVAARLLLDGRGQAALATGFGAAFAVVGGGRLRGHRPGQRLVVGCVRRLLHSAIRDRGDRRRRARGRRRP